MASAVMVRLAGVASSRRCTIVVIRGRRAAPRPLVQYGKETGDVLGDLPGVLAAQIAPETWLPDFAWPVDQVVVRSVRRFHPKTSQAVPRRSVLLASGLGIPPMTLDLNVICISGVPITGIAAFIA